MSIKKLFKNTTLIIGVLFLFILGIKSVFAQEEVPFYTRAIRDGSGQVRFQYSIYGKIGNFVKIMRYDNNDIAYCIEPTKDILDFSQGSYAYVEDLPSIIDISKLSNETISRLQLLSYYGYGYGDHSDDSWYAATQLEIWNTVMPGCCTIAKGDSALIDRNRNAINELVNGVVSIPSFHGTTKNQVIGKTVEYEDNNNVISSYKVKNCENCEASIKNNKLVVKGTKVGSATVELERVITNSNEPNILYYNADYQKVMHFGSPDPRESIMFLNVIGGTVKIQKVDSDTGKVQVQGDGSFEGAEYGIYDAETKELVGTITTNESGYGELTVGMGKFIVKEIKAPKGYLLSDEEFEVEFTQEHIEESLYPKEQVIKGHALLTKLFGDDELGFVVEEGAEFEIYNSKGELVTTIKTDEDGVAVADLVYGSYTIHQTKGKSKFSFIEDIKFTVSEDGKIYKFTAKNLSYPRIDIQKKDRSNNQALKDVTIEIYKYNSDLGVYELYYTGVTDNDGKIKLSDLDLGKYYYLETDVKGYVIDNEKHYFELNEYGKTYYFELYNDKIKGNFELVKKDSETGEYLKGAKIEIYNADTNELVYSGITNEEGILLIEDIEYGKYYWIEKNCPEGYILNTEKHYFDVLEDGKTYEFEFENDKITGELDFTKEDLSTSEPIPNTLIEVYDADTDSLVFSGRTDENGKIVIKDLPYGRYYILEKETASDDYILNTERMYFEIKENGEIVKAVMTNSKKIEVPDTLSNTYYHLIPIGIFLIGIILYIISKFKKNKKV